MKKAIPFYVIIATVLGCASLAPVVAKAKVAPTSEIGRDGHFILYSTGVVRDTKAGLEWVAGPDRDVTWDEARDWVESLNIDGGGWRMPTMDELGTLYQPGRGKRNMTPLLKTTGWLVWSGERKASSSAWLFSFNIGCKKWPLRNFSCLPRAFAVRAQNDR